MAKGNVYLYFFMLILNYDKQIAYSSMLCTIKFGLCQDASTDRETILPIADIKGRDGWMVGHLPEERERHLSSSIKKRGVRYPLAHINFTLAAFHRCVFYIFHTRDELCPVLYVF